MFEYNFKYIEYSLFYVAELVFGGIAVGIGLNIYSEYARRVVDELVVIICVSFVIASNKFEALAICDVLV